MERTVYTIESAIKVLKQHHMTDEDCKEFAYEVTADEHTQFDKQGNVAAVSARAVMLFLGY